MSEFGMMGVDWEERINFDRLRRDRLRKAQEAMESSGLDALFVFALEDVRYLTGFTGSAATLCDRRCQCPRWCCRRRRDR